MLYKGYIKTKGKKAIEAFKDRTKYRTYDEVKNLEGFGGVLADDTILIDIDDAEQSEILMNIVEEYQLDCRVYCTSRGRHFLFKNHSITRNRTHVPLTDCQTKGFAYMYAMKDSTDKLKFTCADSIGVVEVEARFAEDEKDHVIYWYVDRVDKEGHRIKKIMDWDDEQVVYYVQTDEGEIQLDDKAKVNPRPHILYQVDGDDNTYIDSLGFLPFFRLDNNKKQFSNLKAVKDLIDDYDLMASSLSNNLIDFDHPLYAVKGFEGDNLDELQQNLKTKKIVGVGSDGGIEVHTVDVPYEARKVKLELDEKNIYRFGMGLNLSGLKDTSATTNEMTKIL